MEATKWLKPSDSGSRLGVLRECTGRNASERRASLVWGNARCVSCCVSGAPDSTKARPRLTLGVYVGMPSVRTNEYYTKGQLLKPKYSLGSTRIRRIF
jgi:hypothetical protein